MPGGWKHPPRSPSRRSNRSPAAESPDHLPLAGRNACVYGLPIAKFCACRTARRHPSRSQPRSPAARRTAKKDRRTPLDTSCHGCMYKSFVCVVCTKSVIRRMTLCVTFRLMSNHLAKLYAQTKGLTLVHTNGTLIAHRTVEVLSADRMHLRKWRGPRGRVRRARDFPLLRLRPVSKGQAFPLSS